MGNPASVKRKATEKRRKRFEDRLGPGAYLPKAEREKVNAALEKTAAEEKARLAERAKKAAANQAAKKAKRMAAKGQPQEKAPAAEGK
jgi:hypothetical protein